MPVDIGPKIGMTGESEFRKSIQDINTEIKTLGTEMAATTSAFDKNDSSQKKLTAGTGQSVDTICWLMNQLMVSGKRYADKAGLTCPEPMSADDMLDCYDLSDLYAMQKTIQDALSAGMRQDVEATSKNAEATPAS